MEVAFVGEVIEWRGPAPYVYLEVPVPQSDDIKDAARGMEYWGQVAVEPTVRDVTWRTALFPKDGRYLLPLRADVRRRLGVEVGMTLAASLRVIDRGPADASAGGSR
jgi:hypothetical protein